MADIAARCGVSVPTVSKALAANLGQCDLNPETRARVRAVAEEMGWRGDLHTRSAMTPRERTIGLVVGAHAPSFSGVYVQLPYLFTDALARHGLQPMFLGVQDPSRWRARLKEQPIAGAVLVEPLHQAFVEALCDLRFPAVTLNVTSPVPMPQVLCDDAAGVRVLARRLGPGVAWIQAAQWTDHPIARQRRIVLGDMSGGHLRELQYVAPVEVLHWLDRERPAAVLVNSAHDALYVLRAAANLGIAVPRDLRLASCDDLPELSMASVPVTAAAVPMAAMINLAVSMVVDQVSRGGREDSIHRLAPEVVVRVSG